MTKDDYDGLQTRNVKKDGQKSASVDENNISQSDKNRICAVENDLYPALL